MDRLVRGCFLAWLPDPTREAALLAGFRARITSDIADNLPLIDRQETAAIPAMKTTIEGFPMMNPFVVCRMSVKPQGPLVSIRLGRGIILADLSGGTVDLMSYKETKWNRPNWKSYASELVHERRF